MDAELVQRIALFMPALLLSLSVHEYAHAWSATRLGDGTPQQDGRLTLSPLSHIDPFGSILFPLLLLWAGPGVFGWAKPVQFNPTNFSRKMSMRSGAALTAAAGPLSNLLLAVLALVALRITVSFDVARPPALGEGWEVMLYEFLNGMFSLNVLLAIFNILPLPPLDGHYLLPRSMDDFVERIRPYSFLLLVVLFFLPLPGVGRSLGSFVLHPLMNLMSGVMQSVVFAGA